MTEGVKTIMYPVGDLGKAKTLDGALLGVEPYMDETYYVGWQCLELGSGNGSIAEWLSETVSPSRNVTAIDINPVLLELIPAQNLTIRQMDVRTSSGSCQRMPTIW